MSDEDKGWRSSSWWDVLQNFVAHHTVHGCHDCPMIEVHPFGSVRCPHMPFPMEIFIDPLEPKPPPRGCPLLRGGAIVLTLEPPPEAKKTAR